MSRNKIIVVIPAYNEEKNIGEIIRKVKTMVDEVVVVDDGSADRTVKVAEEQKAIVLKHLINRGQGAALETGDQYALKQDADIVIHFDADGQFLTEEIKDIIEPIKNGEAEVVFGSRFMEKKSNMPWLKKNIIFPLARIVNGLIGINLTDPQSGFRALSRKALEKIRIENDGMAHNSEIQFKVFKNNFKVKEVPIKVIYHNFGQRFSGGFKIIRDLLLSKLME